MPRAYGLEPQVALDCRNSLGESIVWDERRSRLYWVDIHEAKVWSWDPFSADSPRITALPERVGALGLRNQGGLVLALEKGFALLDEEGGALRRLPPIAGVPPSTRLNDGRIGPDGRFVCGGMDEGDPQQPIASLFALEAGRVSTLMSGIHCTNSLCWSRDGTLLYFTDMPSCRIDCFDYDLGAGRLTNRRLFVDLSDQPGRPDGSIVDAEGCLWNAQWEGSKLVRYRQDGSVEREVPLPVSNPTCLTFGGPELDVLFVTSARLTLDGEERQRQPHAGSVFAFQPGVRGRREHRYAG
jgi:L-arabinonolactonase